MATSEQYGGTAIGICLRETLDEIVRDGKISPEQAAVVLAEFDKSMTNAFGNQVNSSVDVEEMVDVSPVQNTEQDPIPNGNQLSSLEPKSGEKEGMLLEGGNADSLEETKSNAEKGGVALDREKGFPLEEEDYLQNDAENDVETEDSQGDLLDEQIDPQLEVSKD